uniref:Uncharacterized protein n=1 Tax=Strix occidentalis caurina TaxID=311401 RepID=A0A8D0EYB5_STROC
MEKNKKDSLFHDDNLIASILDLVMAGTETIATTLQWAILLMMKYPEIQKKVQEEIGRTVKSGSWATYEDRKNMPFTNAVLHEVQRFITLLPHVPRCTAVDTHFRGYFLPKVGNSNLLGHQSLCHKLNRNGALLLYFMPACPFLPGYNCNPITHLSAAG